MGNPTLSTPAAKKHLVVEHDLDDELIAQLAAAAVERTLAEVGLAGVFKTHTTEVNFLRARLPYPVVSITSVSELDSASDWQAIDSGDYELSGDYDSGYFIEIDDDAGHKEGDWFQVIWVGGWEAGAEPAWFWVACKLLLAHLYENRSSVVVGQGVAAIELPLGWEHLCRPHRSVFFA